MGFRSWVGNKLFKIDERIDRAVNDRLTKYNSIESDELLSYRMKENQVWANGNADRLLEFYKTKNKPSMFDTSRFQFWQWVGGANVPKLHYPAPEAYLNSIKSLLFGSEPLIEFISEDDKQKKVVSELNARLGKIHADNKIKELRQKGAVNEAYSGTIAIKYVIDKNVSKYPIMQLYPQERIEFTIKYDRVVEVVFKDYYKVKEKTYTLKSIYGIGYIDYLLLDDKHKQVPLATIPELADLEKVVLNKPILMASFKKNKIDNIEFPDTGYGGSDFEGVIDLFHQIDEIFSSMALYIRRARPMTSITEDLLPVSDKGDKVVLPKEYQYDVTVLKPSDTAKDIGAKFHRDIVEIKLGEYLTSIILLQKAIYQKVGYSGITANLETVGANQSGEALKELEKATEILYNNKTDLWEEFMQEKDRLALIYEDIMNFGEIKTDYKEFVLRTEFPDYHSDSFKERAKQMMAMYVGNGVDLETMLKEIWKELLPEEKIDLMIRNVKLEQGIPLLEGQLEVDLND